MTLKWQKIRLILQKKNLQKESGEKEVDCCLVKKVCGHLVGAQRHGLEIRSHTFLRARPLILAQYRKTKKKFGAGHEIQVWKKYGKITSRMQFFRQFQASAKKIIVKQ